MVAVGTCAAYGGIHAMQGNPTGAKISSAAIGICGDNHATCATCAQNMAFNVRSPAIAEWIVNLGEAAEYMFDHNIFQDNLVGVDFCEQMVKETKHIPSSSTA